MAWFQKKKTSVKAAVGADKRQGYRVVYPKSMRPDCLISGGKYAVMNISEMGLMLQVLRDFPHEVGETIQAELSFSDGGSCSVEGTLLRRSFGKAILQLSKGVDLKRIMIEQRLLINEHQKGA